MPNSTQRVVIRRSRHTAQHFIEDLGNGVGLDMVLIPGGTFTMGSPDTELQRRDSEGPQHDIDVPRFLMGRYPVTQEQWREVAGYPKATNQLQPDPSKFKGSSRPVKRVSWDDAIEFCQRLSVRTGRTYRLPSEAEWEYACRAGSTSPFHFGETLSSELANYRAQGLGETVFAGAYGKGIEGEFREQTTDIGMFPANDFGLHDMHGNLWEWCQDDWHESYKEKNRDKRSSEAWKDNPSSDRKVLRGGSWYDLPENCRSASRLNINRDNRVNAIGFRVVCESPRTPGP